MIGVRNLHPDQWWGEGEIKVYMDGDSTFPTIAGTGSEDYVGLAWGLQQATFPYNGASLVGKEFNSMYRWHLADPIAWQRERGSPSSRSPTRTDSPRPMTTGPLPPSGTSRPQRTPCHHCRT